MDNPYAKLALTVGHEMLFRFKLDLSNIIEILSEHPTHAWLDLFSKIEGFLLIPRGKDFDPQQYLAVELFPSSTLTRINKNPKQKEFYFALGQLNVLRKLAIVYGGETGDVKIPKLKISKILLGAQDLQNEYDSYVGKPNDLESFTKFAIRNGYLNMNTSFGSLFSMSYRMYVRQSDEVKFSDSEKFSDFFNTKVGITPEQSMALNFALATPFFQEMKTFWEQTSVIDPQTYFQKVVITQDKVISIIDSLTIDFSEVKEKLAIELKDINFQHSPTGYNLSIFRKTPLVRLPNGKLVCVNLHCLLEKTTQNIIWLPVKDMSIKEERDHVVNTLTKYRGELFETHLKKLCSEFESKNNRIFFKYISHEKTQDDEEVGDSLLIQGDEIVVFEAKSRQFNEAFKYTGDWEKHDQLFMDELVKKSASQIQTAAQKILKGEIKDLPIDFKKITKIYPVVVTYDPVPMFGKVQKFIREKVKEAGYLEDEIFAPFEIINISDLENVMDSADKYTFIDLMQTKNSDLDASEADFHNFLCHFMDKNTVLSNGWQREQHDIFFNESLKPSFTFVE